MGRNKQPTHVDTASGHRVKSYSEARIDDWFHSHGYRTIYEPVIELNGREFIPDWLILPNDSTVMRPIIVEYWGLLRKGKVADWVIKRRERYSLRKIEKEDIFEASEAYDFIGIMPDDISSGHRMDSYLSEQLDLLLRDAALRRAVCQPIYETIADSNRSSSVSEA